jgi:hypothetical protein
MFSGTRLKRCAVSVYRQEPGVPPVTLPLQGTLHSSWINSLERGRRRVIERFLASRCGLVEARRSAREQNAEARPGVQLVLERRCERVTSVAAPPERYAYDCTRGEVLTPELVGTPERGEAAP